MEKKIEIVTGNCQQGDRKLYHSPSRMTVLGGIDAVVQANVSPGSDGGGVETGS